MSHLFLSGPRIFPIADDALTVEFGQTISLSCYEQVCQLEQALLSHPFIGFLESVPAYASLSVFYAPEVVEHTYPTFPTAYAAVINWIENRLPASEHKTLEAGQLITVPVCYDPRCGPDLPSVAQQCGLSVAEVVAYHSHPAYRVFMLGFLPGFAYLGPVDERLAVPRHATPRAQVPAGSVGLAGRQTGIYPTASPGGWQLIGRTPLPMFDPHATPPAQLQPGDVVQFVPITYEAWLVATTGDR